MTYYTPQCTVFSGSATQVDQNPIVYDSQSRPILCWADTGRIKFFSADSGISVSGISAGRGREITLQSGRSYYIWARPNYGATVLNTIIETGIYLNGTNTLVGTKGRCKIGESLRLQTEIYGLSAAAVILPSDFSGSTLTVQVRFEILAGGWNNQANPVNDDTDAQGRGSLVIYSTPA